MPSTLNYAVYWFYPIEFSGEGEYCDFKYHNYLMPRKACSIKSITFSYVCIDQLNDRMFLRMILEFIIHNNKWKTISIKTPALFFDKEVMSIFNFKPKKTVCFFF